MVIQGAMKRLHLVLKKRCILLQAFAYFMQPFTFLKCGELLQDTTSKKLLAVYFFYSTE